MPHLLASIVALASAVGSRANYCTGRYPGSDKVEDGGKSSIDLSKWHLQYEGKKGMLTNSHPEKFHNEDFYCDNKGNLVFCTWDGGGTSGHSGDPRTELTEKGFEKPMSQWKGSTIAANLTVTDVSSFGGPTIAQIHTMGCGHHQCNAALRLRWDPPAVTRKDKHRLIAYAIKDKKGGISKLLAADNVKLGDSIGYFIELDSLKLSIHITVNGVAQKPVTHSYDFMESEPAKFHFKAGSYCDTNGVKDDGKGCLVTFSSLTTKHPEAPNPLVVSVDAAEKEENLFEDPSGVLPINV